MHLSPFKSKNLAFFPLTHLWGPPPILSSPLPQLADTFVCAPQFLFIKYSNVIQNFLSIYSLSLFYLKIISIHTLLKLIIPVSSTLQMKEGKETFENLKRREKLRKKSVELLRKCQISNYFSRKKKSQILPKNNYVSFAFLPSIKTVSENLSRTFNN